MSFKIYPNILFDIRSEYISGRLLIDPTNTYVKIGGNYLLPSVTVRDMSTSAGDNYIDFIVDVDVKFDSNGGVVEEVQVSLAFNRHDKTWFLMMCTRPRVSFGSGNVTLSQRFVTRFYTVS